MTIRTTRRADRDIADLSVAGAETFGVEQAERCVEGLGALFGRLADGPARRA